MGFRGVQYRICLFLGSLLFWFPILGFCQNTESVTNSDIRVGGDYPQEEVYLQIAKNSYETGEDL